MSYSTRISSKLQKNKRKKIALGILLVLVVSMAIFFTLQNPEDSGELSESVRGWLADIGIHSTNKALRSNAHIIVYLCVGIVMMIYGRMNSWKTWVVLALGLGMGLIDEGIKVFLPGREFEFIDLIKNWIVGKIKNIITNCTIIRIP